MWRQFVHTLGHDLDLSEPASREELRAAEAALGGAIPSDLAAFLAESNGLTGEFGLGVVWPVARIVEDNLLFRTFEDFAQLYMPFDPLLFFADAGNGDQFAFRWNADLIDVFVWDHENDSRTWVAPTLEKYLEWWLDGTIKL